MSRTRGKREAPGGGSPRRGGDPFQETAHPKKERPAGAGRGRGKKAAAVVGCLLAALALLAAGWWVMFVRAPSVGDNDRPGVANNRPGTAPGETEDGGESPSGRKEDYFTFLLIGRDTAGGGNTDTLILVSYDVPNGQVNMMSIPRDTAINVPWSVKKINSVFNAKDSSGGGIEGLKTQVAYLTGVMPDFHVIIEWKAVGEIVKAVGGVEFDVPRNMNYDDPYQDLHIHLNKGVQHLNAEQAMGMLRYRNDNGYKTGYNDIGRMNTQRDFLKAMAKEVLQLKNMTKIGEFIKIFMDNVETDLKLNELTWFASKALSVDLATMQSSTLPYIDVGKYRGDYYLMPNGEEILPLVNEQFNPYNQEITDKDLQLLVRNKDGACYVTNGELLDSRWAKPASGSSGTTGGGVTTTEPTGVVADPNAPPPSDLVQPGDNQTSDNQTVDSQTGDNQTGDSQSGGNQADEDQSGDASGTNTPAGENPDDPGGEPAPPPDEGVVPSDPGAPSQPSDPGTPSQPSDPGTPSQPSDPGTPSQPGDTGTEAPPLTEPDPSDPGNSGTSTPGENPVPGDPGGAGPGGEAPPQEPVPTPPQEPVPPPDEAGPMV